MNIWPMLRTDQWKCRLNKELYYLSKELRLSVLIRIAGLQCAGHVARLDEICMPRRLMFMQPAELRKVGRPCMRWRGKVGKDISMLGIWSSWATAVD